MIGIPIERARSAEELLGIRRRGGLARADEGPGPRLRREHLGGCGLPTLTRDGRAVRDAGDPDPGRWTPVAGEHGRIAGRRRRWTWGRRATGTRQDPTGIVRREANRAVQRWFHRRSPITSSASCSCRPPGWPPRAASPASTRWPSLPSHGQARGRGAAGAPGRSRSDVVVYVADEDIPGSSTWGWRPSAATCRWTVRSERGRPRSPSRTSTTGGTGALNAGRRPRGAVLPQRAYRRAAGRRCTPSATRRSSRPIRAWERVYQIARLAPAPALPRAPAPHRARRDGEPVR